MEAQRELVQVGENLDREAAHRVHGDRGEQRVARLLGQRHRHAQDAVEAGQRDDAGERLGQGKIGGRMPVRRRQRVGRPFEGVGDCDRDEFRGDHQDDRQQNPDLQVGAIRGPDIGQQHPDRAQETAAPLAARPGRDEIRRFLMLHGVRGE